MRLRPNAARQQTAEVAGPVGDGWYADPFDLHDARHFASDQPTGRVRDDGHPHQGEMT